MGFVRVEISLLAPKVGQRPKRSRETGCLGQNCSIFAVPKRKFVSFQGAHSSAGSEHLPYKQRVRGSNPCAPTPMKATPTVAFFRRFEEWGIVA